MKLLARLKDQKLLSVTLLVFTLSIGILIGTLINTAVNAQRAQTVVAADATPLVIPSPVQLSTAFSQLAKQLEPSVVNITSVYRGRDTNRTRTRRRTPAPNPNQPPDEDEDQDGGSDLFHRFFGQEPYGDLPQRPFRRQQATGSGVVVDPKGYILTNYHVIEDASRIQVKFNGDTSEYSARLIGADPETDLSVIKLENYTKPLQPARIGNSDSVQVGDWCVAIGSPFGLEATVTAGIISAKGRDIGPDHQLQRFLQTDAAINPGNSGGPLLDIRGQIIGINTAIATESGGYQGVGFALPVNLAANVYNQIIKTGRVSRGSIGVGFEPNQKPEMLRVYGAQHGVFIINVEPGGPADKAGLKVEDVIIALNGKGVTDGDDLVNRVSSTAVGSEATVTVLRDGGRRDFKLKIGERTEVWANDARFRRFRRDEPQTGDEASQKVKFGLEIQNLTAGMRDRLGFKQAGGVVVTSVASGSFADDIGLAPHDVIMAINRHPVNSAEDVVKIQATLKPGQPVAFRVLRPLRGGRGEVQWQPLFAAGTLSANP
jgi:serine protease Do